MAFCVFIMFYHLSKYIIRSYLTVTHLCRHLVIAKISGPQITFVFYFIFCKTLAHFIVAFLWQNYFICTSFFFSLIYINVKPYERFNKKLCFINWICLKNAYVKLTHSFGNFFLFTLTSTLQLFSGSKTIREKCILCSNEHWTR